MSAIQFELPDSRVLDLFAGSGALGLESLSRGAAHATFVETSPRAVQALRSNIENLGAAGECEIVRKDAFQYVAGLEPLAFDIAFADPPYGQNHASRMIEQFRERPFAKTLWIEHGARESLPDVAGARTRRYGDTAITRIPAAE